MGMTTRMTDQGSRRCPPLTAIAQFFQGTLLLDQLRLRLLKLGACPLQQRLCPQAWEEGGKGEKDPRETSVTHGSAAHPPPTCPQTPPPLASFNPDPSPAPSTRVSQQLLQARISRFKLPNAAVCSEAGRIPAPQTLPVTCGDSQDTLPRSGTRPWDRGPPTTLSPGS